MDFEDVCSHWHYWQSGSRSESEMLLKISYWTTKLTQNIIIASDPTRIRPGISLNR